MGGYGSGFRIGGRKRTTEECLTLPMEIMRERIHLYASGTLSWPAANEVKCSVGYSVQWSGSTPVIVLEYAHADGERVRLPVSLLTTQTQFGGFRWWFECPLNGSGCNRRVGRLYLPPKARLFGCRRCHRLSYRSSQTAHIDERMFIQSGVPADLARAYAAILRNWE